MTVTWKEIAFLLASRPAHVEVDVPRSVVRHPSCDGVEPHFGLPMQQIADWRFTVGTCTTDARCIHVREYADVYRVHWDHVDPRCDLIAHVIQDVPPRTTLGWLVLTALVAWGIKTLVDSRR